MFSRKLGAALQLSIIFILIQFFIFVALPVFPAAGRIRGEAMNRYVDPWLNKNGTYH
jgi:hypothetical protein